MNELQINHHVSTHVTFFKMTGKEDVRSSPWVSLLNLCKAWIKNNPEKAAANAARRADR
jgi:hypothetical protein